MMITSKSLSDCARTDCTERAVQPCCAWVTRHWPTAAPASPRGAPSRAAPGCVAIRHFQLTRGGSEGPTNVFDRQTDASIAAGHRHALRIEVSNPSPKCQQNPNSTSPAPRKVSTTTNASCPSPRSARRFNSVTLHITLTFGRTVLRVRNKVLVP
jgi:hypothetical protein